MGASKQHQDLVRVIKLWVEQSSPCNQFDNRFDLTGCYRPSSIYSKDKTVKKSIPDYYGISDDSKICYIGEAKTDIPGQSIHDSRANRQIKAFFDYLIRCRFTSSMFLLAIPGSDLAIAKHIVGKVKKETGYFGTVNYFTKEGKIEADVEHQNNAKDTSMPIIDIPLVSEKQTKPSKKKRKKLKSNKKEDPQRNKISISNG
jgi:hypothetical protein